MAGCALSGAPDPEIAVVRPAMPAQLGPFRLVSRDTLRGAATDSIYRYTDSTSRVRVSVIRYDVPPDVRVGTDTARWLEGEGRKFEAIQPLLVERGVLEGYEVAFAKLGALRFGADSVSEFATAVAVRMRGKPFADLQYLYVIDGRFLKIRATVPPDNAARSEVPIFARELARRLIIR